MCQYRNLVPLKEDQTLVIADVSLWPPDNIFFSVTLGVISIIITTMKESIF